MPPRNLDILSPASDDGQIKNEIEPVVTQETHEAKRPPIRIVWNNIIWVAGLHLFALYGLYLFPWAMKRTWLWTSVVYLMTGLGITAGAHRLWAHRSYKAALPLRILLAIFNCMASQNDIIEWSRDHRVHHRFSETDADPHNAKRGFFFAHCGWLMVRKHPDVKEKGKSVDLSDLLADPVCVIQRKVYKPAMFFFCFIFPALVPWYYWGESFVNAFFICSILRYTLVLNSTWFVNSAAHMWGNKPYDRHINPAENFFVVFGAIGEGYHNYHHVFPSDYSTSEYGWKFSLNLTTMFIDFMAMLGLAYDRKKISHESAFRRKTRTGDGSTGFGYIDRPKNS